MCDSLVTLIKAINIIHFIKVSVTREYHIHKLQTNPQGHEEALQNTNSHKTSERQLK